MTLIVRNIQLCCRIMNLFNIPIFWFIYNGSIYYRKICEFCRIITHWSPCCLIQATLAHHWDAIGCAKASPNSGFWLYISSITGRIRLCIKGLGLRLSTGSNLINLKYNYNVPGRSAVCHDQLLREAINSRGLEPPGCSIGCVHHPATPPPGAPEANFQCHIDDDQRFERKEGMWSSMVNHWFVGWSIHSTYVNLKWKEVWCYSNFAYMGLERRTGEELADRMIAREPKASDTTYYWAAFSYQDAGHKSQHIIYTPSIS